MTRDIKLQLHNSLSSHTFDFQFRRKEFEGFYFSTQFVKYVHEYFNNVGKKYAIYLFISCVLNLTLDTNHTTT